MGLEEARMEEEHGNLEADVMNDRLEDSEEFAEYIHSEGSVNALGEIFDGKEWVIRQAYYADYLKEKKLWHEPDLKDCLCDVLAIISSYPELPTGLYKEVIDAVAKHWRHDDT